MNEISKKFQTQKAKSNKVDKEAKEKENRKEQCKNAKIQLKKYQRAPFLTKMTKDQE